MTKKHFLLLGLTLFLSNRILAQEFHPNQRVYTMNILGAEVHSEPSFSSEVLDTLAFGDSFIIDSATRIKDVYPISEGFSLNSQWYYSKKRGGYLFGSHFTTWEFQTA